MRRSMRSHLISVSRARRRPHQKVNLRRKCVRSVPELSQRVTRATRCRTRNTSRRLTGGGRAGLRSGGVRRPRGAGPPASSAPPPHAAGPSAPAQSNAAAPPVRYRRRPRPLRLIPRYAVMIPPCPLPGRNGSRSVRAPARVAPGQCAGRRGANAIRPRRPAPRARTEHRAPLRPGPAGVPHRTYFPDMTHPAARRPPLCAARRLPPSTPSAAAPATPGGAPGRAAERCRRPGRSAPGGSGCGRRRPPTSRGSGRVPRGARAGPRRCHGRAPR